PPPATARSGRRTRRLAALAAFALGFVVYANTLGHGFVYDDAKQILANPWIADVRYLPDVVTHDVWGFWPERDASSYYRPLMHVAYMLVYQAAGLAPWAYHLLNVLLHAATSALVLFLAERLLRFAAAPAPLRVPTLAALLFAVHPIHSEPVAWAGGLPDLACAFFALLSAHLYIAAFEEGKRFTGRLCASLAAYAMALLAKEPALTLPLLLLAFDTLVRRERSGASLGRLAPYVVLSGLYLLTRSLVLGALTSTAPHPPLLSWLPAVPLLFGRYLTKLILPIGLNAYYPDATPGSWLDPGVIGGLAAAVAFAAALGVTHRRSGILCFGLLFILVPLLPALYLPALGGAPFAERYLYLPSFGFALLVAWAVYGLADRARRSAPIFVASGAALILACSGAATARNGVWRDDASLWSDAVRKAPGSSIPRNNLGRAHFNRGEIDAAIEQYRIALELDPRHAEAHNNLGAALATRGQLEEAERHFLTALELKPRYSDAHNNLGILYGTRGDTDRAQRHFREAVALRPDFADAHHNLGVAYLSAGAVDLAIEHFERALELRPDAVNTHLNLARAYEAKGLTERARLQRNRARDLFQSGER
ncbi:MAG TPA: tetratricopeptide repeat protein, partial [Myxococcota bacterium]